MHILEVFVIRTWSNNDCEQTPTVNMCIKNQKDLSLFLIALPGNPIITQNNTAYQGEMYDAQCLVKGGNPRPLIKWALVGKYLVYVT